MKTLCMLLLAVPMFADVQKGIALFDAGKYDQAIAEFKASLAENPNDDVAAYELGLAYQAKGDSASCIALLEPRLAHPTKLQAAMHAIVGNCYDIGGNADKAIGAYRKGLKINANDDQLLYNLAVTLISKSEFDEARSLLKKEVAVRPDHASGHYALGQVFETQSFRAPALLEYLRFLAIEPRGARAHDAAKRAVALLGMGVEVKDKGNINITMDPNSRKEEGDYSGFELTMALTAAVKNLPESKKLSEFEKTRQHLSSALAVLLESPNNGDDYTATHNVPFFQTLDEDGQLETFTGLAVAAAGLAGAEEWERKNEAAAKAFVVYMQSHS